MPLLTKAYLGSTKLWEDEKAWFQNFNADIVNYQTSATTVTADASTHTKGAWAEVIASSSADASMVVVTASSIGSSGAETSCLVDLGFGAAGSETVKVENMGFGGAWTSSGISGQWGIVACIPLQVPSGTRISLRSQSAVASDTGLFRVTLVDSGTYSLSPTAVDTLVADTATSRNLVMSGSSGTYVEAVASTSQAYKAIAMFPNLCGNPANAAHNQFVVAVGAAGSEVDFGDVAAISFATELIGSLPPYLGVFGRDIPAGSRISVKHDVTSNASTYGVTLIGIP
jgi:hypothetical protein